MSNPNANQTYVGRQAQLFTPLEDQTSRTGLQQSQTATTSQTTTTQMAANQTANNQTATTQPTTLTTTQTTSTPTQLPQSQSTNNPPQAAHVTVPGQGAMIGGGVGAEVGYSVSNPDPFDSQWLGNCDR
jgi:hypothetical protein